MNKYWAHFCTINRHKQEVFKACWKAGIPWQGIMHDVSKYHPAEFFEYARYFQGDSSPVDAAKREKGFSEAWMHHRGCNPHHYEYWIDNLDIGGVPLIMPFKYAVEMVCDYIGAGKAYEQGEWSPRSPLHYWIEKKKTAKVHPALIKFFDAVFFDLACHGNRALRKGRMKAFYDRAINQDTDRKA